MKNSTSIALDLIDNFLAEMEKEGHTDWRKIRNEVVQKDSLTPIFNFVDPSEALDWSLEIIEAFDDEAYEHSGEQSYYPDPDEKS